MDHEQVPVLDALAAYHAERQLPFAPPGHKQGRGADPGCAPSSAKPSSGATCSP